MKKLVQVHESELDQVKDVVFVMRTQEETTYLRFDYIENQCLHHVLDATWRQRIVEWMYGVVDHCFLRRDSVATATMILDICVQRNLIQSREVYQLAAMTALQIAIKLCDSTVVKLQSMVALGRGLFTAQDVIDMERKMLATLNWNCHPPTPVCFLRQFLRLLPSAVSPFSRYMIAEVTRFISEISVCLYRFVKYPPSTVAFAGMIIAIERFDEMSLRLDERHAIYEALKEVGMNVESPLVVEAIAALQMSLENNPSMNDLLSTISSHSLASKNCLRSQECYSSPTQSHSEDSFLHMSSPRDVTERQHE